MVDSKKMKTECPSEILLDSSFFLSCWTLAIDRISWLLWERVLPFLLITPRSKGMKDLVTDPWNVHLCCLKEIPVGMPTRSAYQVIMPRSVVLIWYFFALSYLVFSYLWTWSQKLGSLIDWFANSGASRWKMVSSVFFFKCFWKSYAFKKGVYLALRLRVRVRADS